MYHRTRYICRGELLCVCACGLQKSPTAYPWNTTATMLKKLPHITHYVSFSSLSLLEDTSAPLPAARANEVPYSRAGVWRRKRYSGGGVALWAGYRPSRPIRCQRPGTMAPPAEGGGGRAPETTQRPVWSARLELSKIRTNTCSKKQWNKRQHVCKKCQLLDISWMKQMH